MAGSTRTRIAGAESTLTVAPTGTARRYAQATAPEPTRSQDIVPVPIAWGNREVMDIRQAADYLGISGDTLYRYASEGFVPAFKLGNRWRFKRSRLNDWMDQQSSGGNMPVRVTGKAAEEKPSRAKAKPVQSVRPARRKSAAQ